MDTGTMGRGYRTIDTSHVMALAKSQQSPIRVKQMFITVYGETEPKTSYLSFNWIDRAQLHPADTN